MQHLKPIALASLSLLALAGCGDRADKTATGAAAPASATASNRTLAAVLAAGDAHDALSRVTTNSGLGAVLEGVGPYTVLAPPDTAIKAAGGADLTDPSLKAQGAALLRAHVLPGALNRTDIVSAIDRSAGKGAQMRTMAGGLLTFTRSGDAIVVTAPDGASARLTGEEVLASNGVLQPVDGLLAKPTAAAN
jgi:uncharacterized surface protein with fasciclin (FAS1) repeats